MASKDMRPSPKGLGKVVLRLGNFLLRSRDWIARHPNRALQLLSILRFALCLHLTHLRLKFLPNSLNKNWTAPEPSGTQKINPMDSRSIRSRLLGELSLSSRLAPKDATCLRRSICLRRRFQSLGIDARLVYGVKKSPEGKVLAHAWIESGGYRWDSYGSAGEYLDLKQAPEP